VSLQPTVSVILPTFNRLGYLRTTIDSVFAQTHSSWELVVADDGSDEETCRYLEGLADPRVKTLMLLHSGNPSAVRNAALREAQGEYLAFLDSDDVWLPEKLETQLRLMRAAPTRRWSYCKLRRIDAGGRPIPSSDGIRAWAPYEGDIVEALLELDAVIATPTVIAERSLVESVGGFDELQLFGEDYELWLRLALHSEVSAVPEALTCVRVHGQHYSGDRVAVYAGWVQLYRKILTLVSSSRLRSVCRRRLAESATTLAALQSREGQYSAALRAGVRATASGWSSPRWWLMAAKTCGRCVFPRQ
jgi:glycosyltransferase involved in cell wall biosynthesis